MSPTFHIYMMEAENGRVKIGCAASPASRLATALTMSPLRVRLIAQWAGTRAEERALHEKFAGCRVYREWFDPDAAMRAFIELRRGFGVERIPEWTEFSPEGEDRRRALAAQKRSVIIRQRHADGFYA